MATVQPVSARELDDLLKSTAEVVLLDVRQPDERHYASITATGAAADLFIPLGEIRDRIAEIESAVHPSTFLVIYCHHGVRSMAVANWLADRGIENILNLTGGIDAWSLLVDPTTPRY